jgi:hypothetical protein
MKRSNYVAIGLGQLDVANRIEASQRVSHRAPPQAATAPTCACIIGMELHRT